MGNSLVIINCSKTKKNGKFKAKDIYNSPLFNASRLYAELNGDCWGILSAKYGFILPDKIISSYDEKIKNKSLEELDKWNQLVIKQLKYFSNYKMIILASKHYCGWCYYFNNISFPLKGKRIGYRLQWLNQKNKNINQLKLWNIL
jgi:hypothetical protein